MWKSIKAERKWIAFSTATWCFGKQLFFAIALWGLGSTLGNSASFPAWLLFFIVTVTGVVDGFLFSVLDVAIDKKLPGLHFSERVIIKTLLFMVAGLSLSFLCIPGFLKLASGEEIVGIARNFSLTNLMLVVLYTLMVTLVLQFVKQVASFDIMDEVIDLLAIKNKNIEEDRIFLFLDMKSSTGHAERLGHKQYSLFIQDCIDDMAKAAEDCKAQIYQYVGDEAIFTWETSDENFQRAIRLYFAFKLSILNRCGYYHSVYGVIPEFKAGIHHGKVVKTMVGKIKKSMAFHGDVINTASRIQSKCNEVGCELLISSGVMNGVGDQYNSQYVGDFQLRGKDKEISLFSVEDPGANLPSLNVYRIEKPNPARSGFSSIRLWLNLF